MRIAVIIVRFLMGGMFLMASIMFFLKTPHPEPVGAAKTYMDGVATVNMLWVVKVIELFCGLILVLGRYVALSAVVIFPITVNILMFHAYLDTPDILIPVLLFIGNLFLFYAYRKNYKGIFTARRME